MTGTIMVANVAMVIMPGQRKMVAAMQGGAGARPEIRALGQAAQRPQHLPDAARAVPDDQPALPHDLGGTRGTGSCCWPSRSPAPWCASTSCAPVRAQPAGAPSGGCRPSWSASMFALRRRKGCSGGRRCADFRRSPGHHRARCADLPRRPADLRRHRCGARRVSCWTAPRRSAAGRRLCASRSRPRQCPLAT